MYKLSGLFFLMMSSLLMNGQNLNKKETFTKADTLRGGNGIYRQSWNVLQYDITVEPDYLSKTIQGKNVISFFDKGTKLMQIDLQQPMMIDSIKNYEKNISFSREGNVYWVMLRDSAAMFKLRPGVNEITIYFHGKPVEAVRPPWDGGWIWEKDQLNRPWMSVACQGTGASVWYPCKDIQSDEPDSGAVMRMIVPDTLMAVANGRLMEMKKVSPDKTMYSWKVISPINNYNIVPYIGKYVSYEEQYAGEKGKLDMQYWVLDYNLAKAKKQFTDARKMMKAFEYWFGPFPFYEDGYKLVEAPYLGMEHQSAIAYGNGFQNGYAGKDLSGTGWGMKWDFIVVHESGHEWFSNNITTKDIADMWVHEGFADYGETLFTEYYFGKDASNAYVQGVRKIISNDIPIIGKYGVNKEGSGDMYFKGGNMIHMIRQIINDDEKFRNILRGLNKKFYHQTVDTKDVEQYISTSANIDFSKLFDQYLRTVLIPVLEIKKDEKYISYRWTNCVNHFDMPLKIKDKKGKYIFIYPTTSPQKLKRKEFIFPVEADPNFYIRMKFL